jgi:hypothetical protein
MDVSELLFGPATLFQGRGPHVSTEQESGYVAQPICTSKRGKKNFKKGQKMHILVITSSRKLLLFIAKYSYGQTHNFVKGVLIN